MSNRNGSLRDLIIFALRYDSEDAILSHVVNWTHHFASHFDRVEVYAVHVGSYEKREKIIVSELGGGSLLRRLFACFRICHVIANVYRSRRKPAVLYLMNEKAAAFASPFFSSMGIKQALWYSHSQKSIALKIANTFCNVIFSPTKESFPIKSSKIKNVGHGIDLKKFQSRVSFEEREGKRVLFLGRVSRIKNIDLAIRSIATFNSQRQEKFGLDLAGPLFDESYYAELFALAKMHHVSLQYLGVITPERVPEFISHYQMVFVGNPQTIDKAAVEAAVAGCLVLTEITTLFEHLKLPQIYQNDILEKMVPPINKQIAAFVSNYASFEKKLQEISIEVALENSLEALVERISLELKAN